MQDQIDILHFSSTRLAPLVWRECKALPVSMQDAQAVWLAKKLYVGGGFSVEENETDQHDQALYVYTPATDVWDIIATPVYWFALATYRSQLVLVGGDDKKCDPSLTNKIFTLTSNLDALWQEILPPMLRRCRSPSAVSFESYLLVACGANDLGQQLDTVQIFDGYQWAETLGPLMTSYFIKSAVLNGVWYLTGAEREEQIIYFASLDSLINCCLTVDYGIEESPWQLLPAVPYDFYSLVALGNRLVAIGGDEGAETPSSAIHAYAPNTESWMHVANLPLGLYSTCAIVLPSGELMVVGGHDMCPRQVHMGSLVESDHADVESGLKGDLVDILECTKEGDIEEKVFNFVRKLTCHCNLELKYDTAKLQPLHAEETSFAFGSNKREDLKTDYASPLTTAAWDLRGVEVCGENTVVVKSSHAEQISWEGFGIKLHVHKGSLPAGVEQCTISIKASLAGQYEFPENSHLVSAVYWLLCEPMCKFTKPITVEIQHCARSENVANVKFVRAVCSQKQLPYTFKQLRGNFTSHSSYGVTELNSFSGLAITQEGSKERNYLANLLSKEVKGRLAPVTVEIFFVVICSTDIHRTEMNSYHPFKDARVETSQPIAFELDHVEFKLSKPSRHWKITKLNSAVVRREDVERFSFSETSWIPHSHYRAKFNAVYHGYVSDLECEVDIIGARHPHNKFAIDISPAGLATSPLWPGSPNSPPSTGDFVTRLTTDHLPTRLQQLSEHASKWRDVGTMLGFTQGELESIQASPALLSDAPRSWLRTMLSQWLERAPGDRRGSNNFATLAGLKDALRQAGLGATAYDLHL